MRQKLIGLCGPEGAGKSTAARELVAAFDGEVVPFAAPLKRMLEAIGVPDIHLYGSPEDKAKPLAMLEGKSARQALQLLGTEWGRQCIGQDFWANTWLRYVRNEAFDSEVIIADDVRFPNEVEVIRRNGGIVICVVRSLSDMARFPKHASEHFQILKANAIVVNDGDASKLGRIVAEYVRRHYYPRAHAQSA